MGAHATFRDDQRWYGVELVRPGAAGIASWNLSNQGFSVFSPTFLDRQSGKESPLFSGYLFVQLCLNQDRWRSVNGTRGVQRLLPKTLEDPLPLPVGFVEELQSLKNRGYFDLESAAEVANSFVKDEKLTVKSGPFEGHCGEFQYRKKGLVVLLIAVLGGVRPITVPDHQVVRAH